MSTRKNKTKSKKPAGGKTGFSPSSMQFEEYPSRDMIYVPSEKGKSKTKFFNH